MNEYPLITPLVAVLLAIISIWVIHALAKQKTLKPYLNETVVNFVTAGILIYTLCVWVIGSIAVSSIVW